MSIRRPATSLGLALGLLLPLAACGKKGPPLEPLRLVPAPVGEIAARRAAQEIELRFALPTANVNGGGDIDLDRVEIYAVTVGPGSVTPPNRDLLTKARMVGAIAVRPPLPEGAPEPPVPDKRPAPGDRVTFVEQLTEDKLTPIPPPPAGAVPEPAAKPATEPAAPPAADPTAKPTADPAAKPPVDPAAKPPVDPAAKPPVDPAAKPADPAAAATPAAAAPPPPALTEPARIYVVRGISRAGRPGPPSGRILVPIASPVAPPSGVVVQMASEQAIAVQWTPPVAQPGATPLTFNVYRPGASTVALNPAPIADVKFETAVGELGKEQCFVVRTIQAGQNVTVESELSAPACLTPVDTFPPVAPKGLQAVVEEGAINLVWEPNTEKDIAGYVILRGEAPGDTLQRLTPQPLADANYRDAAVTPGVRYVYALIAVDTAKNMSAQSPPEAATAR